MLMIIFLTILLLCLVSLKQVPDEKDIGQSEKEEKLKIEF
jgi:hypothetical protein